MIATNKLPIQTQAGLLMRSALVLMMVALVGCASTYYNAMEKIGIHKRDILVDRVEDARNAQEEGKEQFKSALARFTEVLNFRGGDLQDKYEKLNDEYERSEEKAEAIRDRIEKVEDVADALFEEWEDELELYTDQKLRRISGQKLEATRSQYLQLITAMQRAESKIEPVLATFRDRVLFLKHNLNAQAIASLQGELGTIESNVGKLIRDIEVSIKEADAFMEEMKKS